MNYLPRNTGVAILALLISSAGAAEHDGANALFTTQSMLDEVNERKFLTWREAEQIAALRSSPSHLSVVLVVLNERALDSSLFSVATPDGKSLTFEGAKSFNNQSNSYSWISKSNLSRADGFGYLSFIWSASKRNIHGSLRWNGKVYEIRKIGRFGVLAEIKIQPMIEPPSMSGR